METPRKTASSDRAAAPAVLIVDDELSVRDSLDNWFRRDGYRTGTARDAEEALRRLRADAWDVVLVDIKMPGMDGLELQRRIHDLDPELCVVMITAYASVDTAVEALKQGAFDYITKPVDPDELSHLVRKAIEQSRLRTENERLRRKIDHMSAFGRIVGDSPPMRKVLEMVRSVAETDATVLIRGESGTGKELIAQEIHARSGRRYFPIVPVNCGALSETLLESELFGHEKGAFTGAQFRRKGRLEMADGGTLFLDEIGTISARMQVELLRVLETKEFHRLGSSQPIRVDFRVVCATNQNLEKLLEEGSFREDLYYRVNVFSLYLPPLRERRQDIPLLARHFLEKYALQMNRPIRDFDPEALDLLVHYPWPGNVRELANAVERAMVLGKPPVVRVRDLPIRLAQAVEEAANGDGEGRAGSLGADSLAAVERRHVARILDRTDWNVTHAAEVLRVDRATIYNKIKKYGLSRPSSAAET